MAQDTAPTDLEMQRFNSGLNVLFLAAFPLLLLLFQGSPSGVFTAVLALFLLGMALRLISRGQRLQKDYDAAVNAERPRTPRKLMGAILIGVFVLILSGHHFVSLHVPLLMGCLACGLAIAAFGMDPLKDKGQTLSVVEPVEEASLADKAMAAPAKRLQALTDRIAALGDADLSRRTAAARDMVLRLARTMINDSGDPRIMRKPIGKFIEILQAEIDRLEGSWEGEEHLFARRRYVAKLQVMSDSFEEHARKKSARRGRDAFDLEADLLLDRMQHETAA